MIVNARNDTRSHGTNEASFLEIGRILGLDKGTVEHIYFIAMRKIKAKMGSELFYDLLDAYGGGLLGGQNEWLQ